MDELSALQAALLLVGGLFAGVVNTLAGGGSLLTVPLLVLCGVPGVMANGTNRVGILVQCISAVQGFRKHGIFEPREMMSIAVPVMIGSLVGAWGISTVANETFERLFGFAMLLLLAPTLRRATRNASRGPARAWPPWLSHGIFLGIGLYAGALQAGVGIPFLFALVHSGRDSVRANAIKIGVTALSAAVAVPIFIVQGLVDWPPALVLAIGFTAGGRLGATAAVRGGDRVIRPVLAVAVVVLAGRMLGLY
jgi:uncharacterized membrane protein YfcA